jgi:DNA-binding transcriptional ArsR family regulator
LEHGTKIQFSGKATSVCFIAKLNKKFKKNFATKWLRLYLQSNGCKKKTMESRRDVFQAIADPSRRAILLLLAVGAMTPNALAQHFNSSRQAVSKHLQVLAACELVTQQQKGREIFYEIKADKFEEIEKWLSQFKQLLNRRFEQLDAVLEQLKKEKQ